MDNVTIYMQHYVGLFISNVLLILTREQRHLDNTLFSRLFYGCFFLRQNPPDPPKKK